MRNLVRLLFAVPAVALMTATAAGAHIVFAEPNAPAGGYYVGFLRVSHGCAGLSTVSIRVSIPAEIMVARPQPKPGWTLSIEKEPLAIPIRSESGGEVRERVTAITWTGRLDADQFDQFGLMLKLPARPGQLYFPTIQRCERGSNAWTTIPAPGQSWHAVPSPAPTLTVTAGEAPAMEHMRMQ